MKARRTVRSGFVTRASALALAALVAACGGGGGDAGTAPPLSCSVDDQKVWLSDYFDRWYFWYALSPRPSPLSASSVDAHFNALLYTGSDPTFPPDRWSNFESTESFNRFFGDGQTLGYGVAVAGLEVTGFPSDPLYVRYVDPLSPASAAGVVRGDRVLAINGRPSFDVIGADDFSALSATASGQLLTLQLRNAAGADRTVTLTSAIYSLTPVPRYQVVTTGGGRKLGYIEVKNMISQVQTPLDAAFASFRTQGVNDIVLDLRYNGGGLVSMGRTIASYVGGTRVAGQTYASLLYNNKQAGSNESWRFASPSPTAAASVPRVFVLMGRRTCSASEQIINGLRGAGLQVIGIGETTCGKPVGFLPESDGCGTTYSVVNFESVNARNEGRYFDGFAATCAVAEDWTQPMGGSTDPLLAAARTLADGGACPVSAQRERPMSMRRATAGSEPGERQGMLGR